MEYIQPGWGPIWQNQLNSHLSFDGLRIPAELKIPLPLSNGYGTLIFGIGSKMTKLHVTQQRDKFTRLKVSAFLYRGSHHIRKEGHGTELPHP